MARRRASRSRSGSAQPAGAALIALGLLAGVSLVPGQAAAVPVWIAARLGQGLGAAAPVFPFLCLLVGLIFFVRAQLRLSPRVYGVLAAYLVSLVALHLRYASGLEWVAAEGRKGGGYVGAAVEVALRRTVGIPGLWTVTVLGAVAAVLLLSGTPVTDALRGALRALRAFARGAAAALAEAGAWLSRMLLAAGRAGAAALTHGCGRAAGCAGAGIGHLGAAARAWTVRAGERARAAAAGRTASRHASGLDPLLASVSGAAVAARDSFVPPAEAAGRAGRDDRGRRERAFPHDGAGAASRTPAESAGPDGPAPGAGAGASPDARPVSDSGAPTGGERAGETRCVRPDGPGERAGDVDTAEASTVAGPIGGDNVECATGDTASAGAQGSGPDGGGASGKRLRAGGGRRRNAVVEQASLGLSEEQVRAYTLPDLSLLEAFPAGKGKTGKADPEEVARHLESTLASFGVEAKVVRWEAGPVVTRYELQPAPGVKVQKITSLQNDIALALAASSVRLEAPIPGKSAVGVELPNERPSLVHLREVLSSEEFGAAPSPLAVAVGKGTAGHPIVADLVAMPHLLIAGATGAGKSVMLNAVIASVLFRSTPEQVRFLMIDPKRVELTNYNGIPHLLSPVVTGPREAAAKLRWAIQEMESRYEMFAADGVRNIQSFNGQHPDRPLAYILIIIDELADLMMIAPADFEEIICRLAQMTRATGIHLLIATQRPSVDVITGLIKANIPSRIAFAVTSQVDSRTILDHQGAEKLLGRGDMLFAPIGASRPTRVQGAFISDAETERLVQFWRAQGEPAYVESLLAAGGAEVKDDAPADDALLVDAARLVVRAGYASVSLLQRKMRIGYVRAARVVDQLEEKGVVGPSQGSSPRDVLVGVDELERVLRGGAGRAGAAAEAEDSGDPDGAEEDA